MGDRAARRRAFGVRRTRTIDAEVMWAYLVAMLVRATCTITFVAFLAGCPGSQVPEDTITMGEEEVARVEETAPLSDCTKKICGGEDMCAMKQGGTWHAVQRYEAKPANVALMTRELDSELILFVCEPS